MFLSFYSTIVFTPLKIDDKLSVATLLAPPFPKVDFAPPFPKVDLALASL